MKRLLTFALALTLTPLMPFAQENTPKYLPAWQEGDFDIHHISTGKGECQLLIFPDGTQMLIDAGDKSGVGRGWAHSRALPDSSKTPARWIADYIKRFAPRPTVLDYVLISHFHADHMGGKAALREGKNGYRVCGILELGDYVRFGKLVDRGWPSYDFPSAEKVDKANDGVMPEYRRFIGWQQAHNGMKVERFEVGSHSQFACPAKKWDFDVWNVAGNLKIRQGKKVKPMYKEGEELTRFDENMFSLVQVFSYGPFKYYSGGDLGGGDPTGKRPFNRDYESQVADLVAPCHVIKADHHGYVDSTNPYFLWKMAPDVVVFDCAEASHPRVETLVRLTDKQFPGKRNLYATSEAGRAKMGEEAWKSIRACGHVVIRVQKGGRRYQVFVLDATKEDCPVLSVKAYNTARKLHP